MWEKRERINAKFIKLGDAEGQERVVDGVLLQVAESNKYAGQKTYIVRLANGEARAIAGSANINGQIRLSDVGRLMRIEFRGWGKSQRGAAFKDMVVSFWSGEITPELRQQYPDLGTVPPQLTVIPSERMQPRAPLPDEAPAPAPTTDFDDELPF